MFWIYFATLLLDPPSAAIHFEFETEEAGRYSSSLLFLLFVLFIFFDILFTHARNQEAALLETSEHTTTELKHLIPRSGYDHGCAC